MYLSYLCKYYFSYFDFIFLSVLIYNIKYIIFSLIYGSKIYNIIELNHWIEYFYYKIKKIVLIRILNIFYFTLVLNISPNNFTADIFLSFHMVWQGLQTRGIIWILYFSNLSRIFIKNICSNK